MNGKKGEKEGEKGTGIFSVSKSPFLCHPKTCLSPFTKFRIAGENPPANSTTGASAGINAGAGACQNYIFSTYGEPTVGPTGVPTSNWTSLTFTAGPTPPTLPPVPGTTAPSYWFAYAIAKEETANNGGRTWYNQFLENGGLYNKPSNSQPVPGKEGYPNWQNDSSSSGSGGYGLFQLTYEASEPNFIMPRDWIWNWQSNVKQFLPIVQQKLQDAQDSVTNTKARYPAAPDPTSLTVTEDATTFLFWESTVITRYNSQRGWYYSPTLGWHYKENPQTYLYDVAIKGIENNP